MKNIKTFIIIVFSILNFSACNTPEPIDQDGTMLWLANGRSYKEVLASVETRIDSTLSKEEYHIYDPMANAILMAVHKQQSVMEYMPCKGQRFSVKQIPVWIFMKNHITNTVFSTIGTILMIL